MTTPLSQYSTSSFDDPLVISDAASLIPQNPNQRKRKVYSAAEHESIDIPLSELIVAGKVVLYPEITGKDYFRLSLKQDKLAFQAGGYVGLIPINDDIALDVRPRVPIRSLERVLQISEHLPVVLSTVERGYALTEAPTVSLLEIFVDALLKAVREIQVNGKHREYIQVTRQTSFPKGRILFGATLKGQLSRGVNHAVSSAWFESTVDNNLNRCLKYAIWYLAQRYIRIKQKKGERYFLRELNKAYRYFDGVTLDRGAQFLADPELNNFAYLPASRWYYKQAITVALTILLQKGIAFSDDRDDILLSSLLINMDVVFENYLRRSLTTHYASLAPELQVLNGNTKGVGGAQKPLFELDSGSGSDVDTRPDIVLAAQPGNSLAPTYRLVVDVKYKPIVRHSDRDDINQVITYAIAYGTPHVVLVHPARANAKLGLQKIGQVGSIAVYQYIYDLNAERLDVEEEKFAHAILTLV